MRCPVRRHQVGRLRVLTVDTPPRLWLSDDSWWLSLYGDEPALARLLAAWTLAARSPHSVLYLPIRRHRPPAGLPSDAGRALDLVLVQHSVALRPADWPVIRRRLGAGRPHTARVPEDEIPAESDVDWRVRRYRGFRDLLRFAIAADTLFVVGSRDGFRAEGVALRTLVDEPDRVYGNTHACVDVMSGLWGRERADRSSPGRLHVELCTAWADQG